MQPVSVVIPLYNKQAYIRRALDSLASQTHPLFEALVVDDGSSDLGAQAAREYPDARVRVLSRERRGASAARNAGIAAAAYELVAFLDADDVWRPDFLETVLALYGQYPQAGIFATAYETDLRGKRRAARIKGLPKRAWQGLLPDYFRSVGGSIPVISSAVMVPRMVFEHVGGFAEGAQLGEDQDMWCRIAFAYPVAYSTRPCAVYFLDTQNSVCRDLTVMQDYPVIATVTGALARSEGPEKWLLRYLSKLYLDYAVRLIRARRFGDARAAIKKAGFRMPGMRLRAEYYLACAAARRLLRKEG